MKFLNFYSLLLLLSTNFAFGQIFTEDFSTPTNNTGIDGGTNSGDYPGGVNWSLDVSGATLGSGDYAMTVGGGLEFQDTDGPVIWTSESVNISGCTGVGFSIDINEIGDHESTDFVLLEYSTDGGSTFTSITNWNGLGDASNTLIGDIPDDDDWQTETVTQGGLTGSSLVLRITVDNNAGSEQIILDNMIVTGSCTSNIITTGTVSPLSYTVDCSAGQSGTVDFTSTGTFNGGNIFTAQLSDASGSFASPVSIGTLTLSGTDPTGTINFTIPAGTVSGTGYRIRVVSDDPFVAGSDNGTDITITLSGGPCVLEPPHMTSLIINSCNTSCSEGDNEVVFGNTGDYSVLVNSSNVQLYYDEFTPTTTDYTDILVTNPTTTSDLNTAASCPGLFVEGTGSTIPPNSSFMIVHNDFCPGDGLEFDNFCGQGPIYVIYTNDVSWNNVGGNFVNSSSCSGGIRYLTTVITATDGSTHTIDYEFDCTLNSGSDGDYAKWNSSGGMAIEQGNNGCALDPVVLPVDLVSLSLNENNFEGVDISWETSSELNNEKFMIYHSTNGSDFAYITSVAGKGTTNNRSFYSAVHRKPIDGINYYMLRSVDYDGTIYFKGISAIEVNKNVPYYNSSTETIHFPTEGNYQIITVEGRVAGRTNKADRIKFSGTGILIIQDLNSGDSYKISID